MERIEDCISFVVGKAMQQVNRQARERLAPFGVTPIQYAVLKSISDDPGLSATDLGRRLVLDSASITGALDRLQASNLVERRSDPTDRRAMRLHLTPVAQAKMAKMDAEMDALNDAAKRALGGDHKRIWSALRRISDDRKWG